MIKNSDKIRSKYIRWHYLTLRFLINGTCKSGFLAVHMIIIDKHVYHIYLLFFGVKFNVGFARQIKNFFFGILVVPQHPHFSRFVV